MLTPQTKATFISIVVCLTTLFHVQADLLEDAELEMKLFFGLKGEFNELALDYYADDAEIHHDEYPKEGIIRENHLTGKKYKMILKKVWPMAKRNNDVWAYTDLTFSDSGNGIVEISGTRSSSKRHCEYPYEAKMRRLENGQWRIIYEYLRACE